MLRFPYRVRTRFFSMVHIHKAGVRQSLKPRREPYWTRVQRGQYIGFRKLDSGSETWIARLRAMHGGEFKHFYESLGPATKESDFDQAKTAAERWFPEKLRELERDSDGD